MNILESQPQRGNLQFRGLKPAAVLAASRPHGDRLRYIAGCRCDLCRQANTAYERSRKIARDAGDWNGIVSAAKARAHMLWLAKRGVGRRAVGAATDISDTILSDIRSGRKLHIRARTERKILAVTVSTASDHALTPAGPSWKLINELLDAGFTKSAIALGIGRKTPALQLNRESVTVRNAYLVAQLHARLINSDEVYVDADPSVRRIRELRVDMYSARQIATELGLESQVEDGELRIAKKITRRLEKQVAELYERWMS